MRYYKKIELLMSAVMENKKQKGGVPMAAVMFNHDGTIIGQTKTNIKKRDIPKDEADKHQHHAEQLIKKSQKSLPKNFVLISLLPPCTHCLAAITEENNNVEIYYLTDSIRKRCESEKYNKNLDEIKGNVSLKFLDVHNK